MAKRDYYEVLEVAKNANEAELKKAYRRLAMKFHPDRNPGDAAAEERFKEVKEAYETLTDPRKRMAYDQFGHEATSGGFGNADQNGFGAGVDLGDVFGSVFRDIFGGAGAGATGARAYRGSDLRYNLEITLEEAVFGTTAKLRIPRQVVCRTCNGTGARPGSKPVTCPECGGTGQIRMQQGFFSIQQTCRRCHGRGTIIVDPCQTCDGTGRVEEIRTLSVKVPPGVDNNDRIRLSGEGEMGEMGGAAGDLYVQLRVKPHPIFARQSSDLYCEVPISFPKAALGGDIEVPTLDGRVTLKIPAETQTGKQFRLRNKGVKSIRGGAVGDLICRVAIETPVNLTREQRELLDRFAATLQEGGHHPQERSWLDGVKKFFEDLTSTASSRGSSDS